MQEFCNGGSLREAVASGCFTVEVMPRRWGPLMLVLGDIAGGMAHMHAKRICHGDLNPSNILLKVCRDALCMLWLRSATTPLPLPRLVVRGAHHSVCRA